MPACWNGRQAWLRTTCPKGRAGSNPAAGTIFMDEDYEKIEEDLKKKDQPKEKIKKSGKSVFKLKEIIMARSADISPSVIKKKGEKKEEDSKTIS